jgi:hypothetical protein
MASRDGLLAAIIACFLSSAAATQNPRTIDRADDTDRLRAMWLGQCIANWTGLPRAGRAHRRASGRPGARCDLS